MSRAVNNSVKYNFVEQLVQSGYQFAYVLWKLIRRYFVFRTHGAQTVVLKEKNILLVKACYRDTYCFPGGYVKRGEEPLSAAQRELEEEAGVLVLESQLKFVEKFSAKCHKAVCEDSIFEVVLDRDALVYPVPDGKETVEARFFSISEIRNLDLDSNVKKYLEIRKLF
ncbi:MAG: NUDIX hydrolase [Kangiellaceae bacterium]|nr:NUDIX hydrolase [Kangiellaceae bacterium]MCW8997544.1 NUDIX hydrolase [Kangiellaceae bacterium]